MSAAPLWTGDELRAATGGRLTRPFAATGVSIDTRSLRPGDLFVALVGENGDGHRHVAEALARGACGAMVHDATELADLPLLVVRDTREGLHDLGAAGRARFTGRAMAVTGSVGKTTTKEMLRAILGASGPTHAAEASHNNHWGVPLTLARLPREAAYLVAEIGMNHAGEIAPLSRLVRPHVAVVVSVGSAHIGQLGSLEAIADEKASVAVGLEPDGTVVLPGDHPLLPRLLAGAGGARVLRFAGPDAAITALAAGAEGSEVTARFDGRETRFRLGAAGEHMARDAVAALLAAGALGADVEAGAATLAGFHAGAGRGLRRPILGGRATLLDESYNASAASVRAALEVLRLTPATRRLAVLGDMRELGAHGPAEHAGLAQAVAASADRLHSCGELMRHLHDAVPPALRGAHAADAATLAPLVAAELRPGDAVLVKGSFGSAMRRVVQALDALASEDAA